LATTDSTTGQTKQAPTVITLHVYYLADGLLEELDEAALDHLFKAFAESKLEGATPNRFGFVKLQRFNGGVFYGYFAHEYARQLIDYDDSKEEVRRAEGDFVRYAFILDVPSRYLYVHRRHRPYPTVPDWQTVFARLTDELRVLVRSAELTPPFAIEPLTEGESRQQFLDAFFDRANEVTFVELEDFRFDLIPEGFHFFNPHEEWDEALRGGMAETIPALQKATISAKPNRSLSRTPVVKGLMRASESPKRMRVVRTETKTTRYLRAEKEITQTTTTEIEGLTEENVTEVLAAMSGVVPSAQARGRALPSAARGQRGLFEAGSADDAASR
jgi:hypothetical protein